MTSATAQLTVVTYPQKLLDVARSLIDQGQFGVAVIVAHMACEIATERALSEAFVIKDLGYLDGPIRGFMNGHNLNNERNRKLYTALTGDQIEKASFWRDFKTSAEKRNRIVHGALIVGREEAESSHAAAVGLVGHLRK